MVESCIFVALCLSVHLFLVQAENVSGILDEQKKNASHSLTRYSKETQLLGFKNKSFYERECDCGYGSKGCHYEFGKKICDCNSDYSQNNDKCERCYCGLFSDKCTFENNEKVCYCMKNYLQTDYGQCRECDCGYDAESCHFNGFTKVCTCRDGYLTQWGKCEKCDCGPKSISCDLTSEKYTRCTCEPGYVAERSRWEMNEECKLPGVSGWRIATYIESVFFAIIIIAGTIIICFKRVSE